MRSQRTQGLAQGIPYNTAILANRMTDEGGKSVRRSELPTFPLWTALTVAPTFSSVIPAIQLVNVLSNLTWG